MNTAIIAAAGCGSRMKSKTNKQFMFIELIPVLARTLKTFCECDCIDNIIISAREEDIEGIKELIDKYSISKVTDITKGGETRQESVYNALKLAEYNSIVLIHDGARPFVSDELIKKLVSEAEAVGASVPGIIPKDTIAVVDEGGYFKNVTVRSELRNLQTPQTFKANLIKEAHEKAKNEKREFTDDCSLFNFYGGKVRIIEGEQNNIKITVPEDIPIAELIAKNK